ncbi:MAG: discoidin domain-containing protein [Candidatus Gracilibacteria bacterium]
MIKLHNKKAFTLVELIVVITILAILGTIAFISLQGYSASSRDSVRISDVSNMKTSLELFHLNAGKYPLPDNLEEISYSGDILWYQGTLGQIVVSQLSRNLNEIPTDPLSDKEYIFSTSGTRNEFEILNLLEGDLAFNTISKTNAVTTTRTPRVDGQYNRLFIKTANYIVPTPSILTSETILQGVGLVLDGTNIKSQIIDGGENIPNIGGVTTNTGALNIELSVYSGPAITSNSSVGDKLAVITAIQNAYSGSVLANLDIYKIVLDATTEEELLAFVDTVVLNTPTVITVEEEEGATEDSISVVGNPTLETKTDTTIDLLAGTFTDTDGVQNVTIELYSDSGLINLIGSDANGQFASLLPSTDYYGVTKGEAYNLATTSWEIKRSSGFFITTEVVSIPPSTIVSLLGTNNLITASYTASSLLSSYSVAGAFDGFRRNATEPFLSVPGFISLEGAWTSDAGLNTNQWLTIQFNQPTVITNFSVYPKSGQISRFPKNIKIQYSNDGINFTDHQSFTLIAGENIDVDLLISTPSVIYVRLFMLDNFGDASYLQLDEFVLSGYFQ